MLFHITNTIFCTMDHSENKLDECAIYIYIYIYIYFFFFAWHITAVLRSFESLQYLANCNYHSYVSISAVTM